MSTYFEVDTYALISQSAQEGGFAGRLPAFDRNVANFTGLASRTRIYISDIEHKTVVKVDESGTVAAGATEAELVLQSMPIDMIMDRPFFYAIVDGKTGALLFVGTLIDPIQSSS